MNKIAFLFQVLILVLNTSCTENKTNNDNVEIPENPLTQLKDKSSDTMAALTGFYFLESDINNGVKIKKEGSNENYILSKTAFASVNNIIETKLVKTKLSQGDYTELCMKYDEKGTKDLAEGTGNILYPQIAVVVAGKLLYVIDNTSKIKTGVMCVGLIGYSQEEMQAIKTAVDQKH